MSSNLTNVSFRIDAGLKNDADNLFQSLGMNMTTAFNIFLRQAVREGGIPFKITTNTPNAKTLAAINEAEELIANPNTRTYPVDEALEELKK